MNEHQSRVNDYKKKIEELELRKKKYKTYMDSLILSYERKLLNYKKFHKQKENTSQVK